jgi:tetratricopeptide (TPR) repeat protein
MNILSILIIASSIAYSQSERSLIREGNKFYSNNKYLDAEVSYRKSLETNKDSKVGAFNLGDALYKQEKYDEAAEEFRIATLKETDKESKAKAFHNLGNSLLKSQKLQESIEAYKNALKLNPNDLNTKYNLEYAKRMMQQQQQQNKDQQKQDKQEDKQKQDKQDQQKQNKQDQQKQDKQNQQKQEQQKQDQPKQQQAKQQDQKISKEDAERMLEALKNEEKDVQKKLQKKVPARISIEKDW